MGPIIAGAVLLVVLLAVVLMYNGLVGRRNQVDTIFGRRNFLFPPAFLSLFPAIHLF